MHDLDVKMQECARNNFKINTSNLPVNNTVRFETESKNQNSKLNHVSLTQLDLFLIVRPTFICKLTKPFLSEYNPFNNHVCCISQCQDFSLSLKVMLIVCANEATIYIPKLMVEILHSVIRRCLVLINYSTFYCVFIRCAYNLVAAYKHRTLIYW